MTTIPQLLRCTIWLSIWSATKFECVDCPTLTPTEFKLLETFAKAPGRTFTRQELVERAFGWDYDGLDRTVDAHIMNLRKKLDSGRAQSSLIATVFGVGYKFSGEHSDEDHDS